PGAAHRAGARAALRLHRQRARRRRGHDDLSGLRRTRRRPGLVPDGAVRTVGDRHVRPLWTSAARGLRRAGRRLGSAPVAGDDRYGATVTIRPPAVAGAFYPAGAEALAGAVDRLLDSVAVPDGEPVGLAYVVPHAGYRYSGPTAAQAYA